MEDLKAQFKKLSIDSLQDQHSEILKRAITNILSTKDAELAFAQIIDGLPLADAVMDTYEGNAYPGHPLLEKHRELCPGVLDKARQLRTEFDPNDLQVDSRLIYAYQAAAPGSRAFQTRLIELVVVVVHQIAVHLFNADSSFHKADHLGTWQPPEKVLGVYPDGVLPPTLFQHPWYHDFDQYPNGIADVAGYWAESRIFGGVVLFDRREPDSAPDVEPDAIYLHADKRDVTYRIYRLLDVQKQQLLRFLQSEAPAPPDSPLPFKGDLNNRHRVDPEEPIETTGIYRDKWERKPLTEEDADARMKDVLDLFNYVTYEWWEAAKYRAMDADYERRYGHLDD